MSDNWVVQNLEKALNVWNDKLSEIWQLLTQSPTNFKGGTLWNVVSSIHGALQAIGYKEFVAAVDGQISWKEAEELVKLRSRQYAKRQLTWLRRNPDIHWILWGEEPNFPQGLQNATEYLTALGLR